jgi:uncharacterized phage infection (PIP) family protein YhgE
MADTATSLLQAKSKYETAISNLKDTLTVVRDGVLVIIFVLLLVFPASINKQLTAAGFTKGTIAGFEWEKQIADSNQKTQTAGNVVDQLQRGLDDYEQQIQDLADQTKDPRLKASLQQLATDMKSSQDSAQSANGELKQSLLAQQQIIQQVDPSRVQKSGWLRLGKITSDKTRWVKGSPETIDTVGPDIQKGETLKLKEDAYLRDAIAQGSRSGGSVVAAAKAGTSVRVDDVTYETAKKGALIVWAQVQLNP